MDEGSNRGPTHARPGQAASSGDTSAQPTRDKKSAQSAPSREDRRDQGGAPTRPDAPSAGSAPTAAVEPPSPGSGTGTTRTEHEPGRQRDKVVLAARIIVPIGAMVLIAYLIVMVLLAADLRPRIIATVRTIAEARDLQPDTDYTIEVTRDPEGLHHVVVSRAKPELPSWNAFADEVSLGLRREHGDVISEITFEPEPFEPEPEPGRESGSAESMSAPGPAAPPPLVDAIRTALAAEAFADLAERRDEIGELDATWILEAFDGDPEPHVRDAARRDDVAFFDAFAETGLVQDAAASAGRHAIHDAAEAGSVDVVAFLLAEDAVDVDVADEDGRTPLHLAASLGSIRGVRVLLDHGAEVDLPDDLGGRTALHLAAHGGHMVVVEMLIEQGNASVDARTNRFETPLHLAAGRGVMGVCRLLLEAGADPDARDANDQAPADHADPLHAEVADHLRSAVVDGG